MRGKQTVSGRINGPRSSDTPSKTRTTDLDDVPVGQVGVDGQGARLDPPRRLHLLSVGVVGGNAPLHQVHSKLWRKAHLPHTITSVSHKTDRPNIPVLTWLRSLMILLVHSDTQSRPRIKRTGKVSVKLPV
jgi:hypothetical protein